ncbi:MAG: Asp-tRNA(Asn)/Glu-tRNA(Gln) amidotransferase subunit GatC [Gammaproteobacteria bacterium]|nr:Asp-tRNA(Asn)/Glu-tRNA(Gln) amidotransferase subunit GatC [Gammaproteobacteria bacterium]
MSIDSSEIRKIAWLARLAPGESEISDSALEMGRILDMVEQMNSIDTSEVEALAHPLDICARLRADEVTETDNREHFHRIAPSVAEGHYLVPKVIE